MSVIPGAMALCLLAGSHPGRDLLAKFWPGTGAVRVDVGAEIKPFTAGIGVTNGVGTAPTCGGTNPGRGFNQFACCR